MDISTQAEFMEIRYCAAMKTLRTAVNRLDGTRGELVTQFEAEAKEIKQQAMFALDCAREAAHEGNETSFSESQAVMVMVEQAVNRFHHLVISAVSVAREEVEDDFGLGDVLKSHARIKRESGAR